MANKPKVVSWFLLCFAAPLVLAALCLQMGWFTAGANNYGTWLTKETAVEQWSSWYPQGQWGLVYFQGSECPAPCDLAVRGLAATQVALGKLAGQVQVNVIGVQSQAIAMLPASVPYRQSDMSHQYQQDAIYLIDPFGKVLLSYSLAKDEQANFAVFKGAIADLKKLINYQRRPV